MSLIAPLKPRSSLIEQHDAVAWPYHLLKVGESVNDPCVHA